MVTLSNDEAILFRMLTSFFGEDRVVPHMSVLAVCGGDLPGALAHEICDAIVNDCSMPVVDWAKSSKCLFTVVNKLDQPRFVMELRADFSDFVDLQELQRKRYMQPFLEAAGITYIAVSAGELSELCDPHSNLDFFQFLRSKFEHLEVSV